MRRRIAIVPILFLGCVAFGAESNATNGPWTETFTMTLKDAERTFVVHGGVSYLVAKPDDFSDRAFLSGKDILVISKFERGQGDHISLYTLPDIDVRGGPELWSARVDGDNIYVFGRMGAGENSSSKAIFQVTAIEPAPSDMQLIAKRLQDVQKTDWQGRLSAGAWAREQSAAQGNKEFWLQQADAIVTRTIEDAATQAEAAKDFDLTLKTISWSVDLLHDPIRAARISSRPWIRSEGGTGAEEISKRMHRLGMEFYREQWRPRSEALVMEYDDRFASIPWKDADGFYKLGRWSDANADFLPQAKDRSYRAYQAALRGNPDHAGARRELGLDVGVASDNTSTERARVDYKDVSTGVRVQAPLGWHRGDAINGDATWIDPNSETSYISVHFAPLASNADFNDLWTAQTTPARTKPGFTLLAQDSIDYKRGQARRLRYSIKEERYTRFSELLFAIDTKAQVAITVSASMAEEEQDAVHRAVADIFEHLSIPNEPLKSEVKPDASATATGKPAPAPQGTLNQH